MHGQTNVTIGAGTLGCSVLGIGSGVASFLMIAEYATYRYLQRVVNVKPNLLQVRTGILLCACCQPYFLSLVDDMRIHAT